MLQRAGVLPAFRLPLVRKNGPCQIGTRIAKHEYRRMERRDGVEQDSAEMDEQVAETDESYSPRAAGPIDLRSGNPSACGCFMLAWRLRSAEARRDGGAR
jgi:hypothetical protein